MTDEPDNLVLELLRKIRTSVERTEVEIGDVKLRMSAMEGHMANMQLQMATFGSRMDRLEECVSRIERRLDLIEA